MAGGIDVRRLFFAGVILALVLAACGGDSGDGGDGGNDIPDETQATQPETGTDDTEPSGSDDGDDGDGTEGEGPSTATVTIGDETYNFSSEGAVVAQCLPDLFGIFSVQLPRVDGEGSIQIIALHEGTDPAEVEQINVVHVTIGDVDWVADPEDVRIAGKPELVGLSQVDSVQVSGSTVTGTATFIGSQSQFTADSDMATGTFEATCGEERTS
jgi:hypothetical protein